MVKLTKSELARRTVVENLIYIDADDCYSLDDIIAEHGPDLTIHFESGYYDDPDSVTIRRVREETDEEYKARISELRAQRAAYEKSLREKRAKREEDERKTYERLKKKFEKNK